MLIGKVYKLSASGCDKIYIGSTHCKYSSVRMAHHRQNHRRGWKDYQGLFDNGDPQMEILDTIELNNREEAWKLRKLEEEHSQKYDNLINLRRCYLSDAEKIKYRDESIKKYHSTPLGKLAIRKSTLNSKLKKIENNSYKKTIHPSMVKQIKEELKFINEQQDIIRGQKA
tara:strand:- start:8564 stop:9073 length:510 start_codon:yes stop_codon:yes gene_type:complete